MWAACCGTILDRGATAMQPNVATNSWSGSIRPISRRRLIMFDRRSIVKGLAAVPLVLSVPAFAHHGWSWAADSNFEITGTIKSAKLGNPHGILKIDSKGEEWTVEVGQPWRNARAGLKDAMLAKGVELTIRGNRAKDPKLKVVKAVRVIINGKNHDLYPERIS
jgi:Family of unknown function (DUF6152)